MKTIAKRYKRYLREFITLTEEYCGCPYCDGQVLAFIKDIERGERERGQRRVKKMFSKTTWGRNK